MQDHTPNTLVNQPSIIKFFVNETDSHSAGVGSGKLLIDNLYFTDDIDLLAKSYEENKMKR